MPGNPTKPSGPARSTRNSVQRTTPGMDHAEASATVPANDNSDSESSQDKPTRETTMADNIDELREEIERLQAQVSRLTREGSILPTTESGPTTSRQAHDTPSVRFLSETPSLSKVKLSERTPTLRQRTEAVTDPFRPRDLGAVPTTDDGFAFDTVPTLPWYQQSSLTYPSYFSTTSIIWIMLQLW
jgi:hypothetical protein